MRFSVCRENITPDWPMRMAGYRSRIKPNTGIYDQLYAMALLLDDGEKKALLISIDVCMIDRLFTSEIKKLIKREYGLNKENVIIHAIHTHAGPVTGTLRILDAKKGTPDYNNIVKYRDLLEKKIMACVNNCMSNLKEGYMEIGTGETYIGMSRRQKTPDGFRLGPNPDEEIDRMAYALTIKNTDGKVEVLLFSCSCHPVVLYPRNTKISADFPGAARAEIEKKLPGAFAMFMQGPGADINPAVLVADDDYRDTYYSDVLLTGRILANDIYNILQKGMQKLELSIEALSGEIALPLDETATRELEPQESNITQGKIQVSVIKLSKDLRIVGLEGEICNHVGIHIRELFEDGYTLVLGYTDGWVGYIPTAKIMEEGGYESKCTEFARPFASNVEKVLLKELKQYIF